MEMICHHATGCVLGHANEKAFARNMRSHEEKNFVNAYHSAAMDEERSAREAGDYAAARRAFKAQQKHLHSAFNALKNSALYVDFSDGEFTSPLDAVSETDAEEIAAINRSFLNRAHDEVLQLRRLENNEHGSRELFIQLFQLAKDSRRQPSGFLGRLQELFDRKTKDVTASEPPDPPE